jgi:hypothetical protein
MIGNAILFIGFPCCSRYCGHETDRSPWVAVAAIILRNGVLPGGDRIPEGIVRHVRKLAEIGTVASAVILASAAGRADRRRARAGRGGRE